MLYDWNMKKFLLFSFHISFSICVVIVQQNYK